MRTTTSGGMDSCAELAFLNKTDRGNGVLRQLFLSSKSAGKSRPGRSMVAHVEGKTGFRRPPKPGSRNFFHERDARASIGIVRTGFIELRSARNRRSRREHGRIRS